MTRSRPTLILAMSLLGFILMTLALAEPRTERPPVHPCRCLPQDQPAATAHPVTDRSGILKQPDHIPPQAGGRHTTARR